MLQRSIIWIGWIAVMALALWLRIDDLEARPIHFDEATGANIFSKRIEDAGYRFDPTHYHGPFLSMSTSPIAKIYGQASWEELSLSMLRTGPLIAGMLMVLTPLLWLRTIGPRAALAAAAFLACSPLLVYYNRMYIHESWLALFGMLTAPAVFYLIQSPSRNRALLAGLAAGLMFVTKETVAISLICWSVAGAACWLLMKSRSEDDHPVPSPGLFHLAVFVGVPPSGGPTLAPKPPKGGTPTGAAPHLKPNEKALVPNLTSYFMPAVWFTVSLLVTGAIFYTDGFREPSGLVDAFRTYFVYETTAGHDKAFGYYFNMLIWPKHLLGIWWSEGGIALFGILACVLTALRNRRTAAVAFIALGGFLHLLIYSLISYKTPWLMTLPWALACLLAGCALMGHTRQQSIGKSLPIYVGLVLCLCYQSYQSVHANGRLSNHADNPYAYVPTSKNMDQLPKWLKELEAFMGDQKLEPIAVIGRGYWPLPWYLRDFDQVGYWPEPPEKLASFSVVISMPEKTASCNTLLADTHTQLPRTLRSNVPITLYLRNDIWAAWTDTPN